MFNEFCYTIIGMLIAQEYPIPRVKTMFFSIFENFYIQPPLQKPDTYWSWLTKK